MIAVDAGVGGVAAAGALDVSVGPPIGDVTAVGSLAVLPGVTVSAATTGDSVTGSGSAALVDAGDGGVTSATAVVVLSDDALLDGKRVSMKYAPATTAATMRSTMTTRSPFGRVAATDFSAF